MLLRIVGFSAFVFTEISFMKHCDEWLMLGYPFSADSLLNSGCCSVLLVKGTQPELPPQQDFILCLIGSGVMYCSHYLGSELPLMIRKLIFLPTYCNPVQSYFIVLIWNWVTCKTFDRWQCAYVLQINMHIDYQRNSTLSEYVLHILRELML